MPQPIMPATPGPLSVLLLRSSERMLDASNARPTMRPDVLVRRCGRGAASACFDARADDGADDGAAATCVAEATAVVGADLGGSDLATTAFSAVLGAGATFTGAAGFGCVVDLAAAVSTFAGALATASAFTGAVT